jgi:hypothetical protein
LVPLCKQAGVTWAYSGGAAVTLKYWLLQLPEITFFE